MAHGLLVNILYLKIPIGKFSLPQYVHVCVVILLSHVIYSADALSCRYRKVLEKMSCSVLSAIENDENCVLYNIILCHTIRYYCIFCVYIFNLNHTKQYVIYILYDTLLYYMIVYDIMSYHSTIDNASIKIINFDFDNH